MIGFPVIYAIDINLYRLIIKIHLDQKYHEVFHRVQYLALYYFLFMLMT